MQALRNGAARAQAVYFLRLETQLFENLVIVLSDFRCALCRHFSYVVHLYRTADRKLQIPSGAFERDNDTVGFELRIFDNFTRSVNDAVRKVTLIEDFLPVRHRL